MEVVATSTAATPLSVTQHAYFNLSGGRRATIHDHRLRVMADRVSRCGFTGHYGDGVPTGETIALDGSLRDLRRPGGRPMGEVLLGQAVENPRFPHGEEYVLVKPRGEGEGEEGEGKGKGEGGEKLRIKGRVGGSGVGGGHGGVGIVGGGGNDTAEAPLVLPPFAAELSDPESGRHLAVYTTEPVLQTYYSTFTGGAFVRACVRSLGAL
jgi:hypothetical protein